MTDYVVEPYPPLILPLRLLDANGHVDSLALQPKAGVGERSG
jgi:hypothetical protein